MPIRVSSHTDMQCEMSVCRYRSRAVDSKVKPVHIESVSDDGLRFITELQMPPDPGLLLSFAVSFRNQSAERQGRIAYAQPRGDGRFAYDVRFESRPGNVSDTGWRELLRRLAACQQLRYFQADAAYKGFEDRPDGKAELDLRG